MVLPIIQRGEMRKNVRCFLLFFAALSLFTYSCATFPGEKKPGKAAEAEAPAETEKASLPTKDETESLALFTEVLDLVESSRDRRSVLPRIEEIYIRILNEYPDTPLAQESYWKLITIYVEDYAPPAYEKAESRYHQFLKKYRETYIKDFIEDTLGNSYYKHAEWNRLLKLSEPEFRHYNKTGKKPRASMIYMYAEAQYHLGRYNEAEKAYGIVSEQYPKLIVGIRAKAKLKQMKKHRK